MLEFRLRIPPSTLRKARFPTLLLSARAPLRLCMLLPRESLARSMLHNQLHPQVGDSVQLPPKESFLSHLPAF